MLYLYLESAGTEFLKVDGDTFKHLFVSRRTKKNETLRLRNLKDDFLYTYKIDEINKREALLTLLEKEEKRVLPSKNKHLIVSIIDTKEIEKIYASLSELGITKITFFYASYSQKNFKLNTERLDKIELSSMQQSGRTSKMEVEYLATLKEVVEKYPNLIYMNFGGEKPEKFEDNMSILIGPEGGFNSYELTLLDNKKTITSGDITLKAMTACLYIASL